MLDDHSKISIAEYRTHAKKLQAVQCALHPELPYVEGCENCLTAFCVQCKVKAGSCKAGMYLYKARLNLAYAFNSHIGYNILVFSQPRSQSFKNYNKNKLLFD